MSPRDTLSGTVSVYTGTAVAANEACAAKTVSETMSSASLLILYILITSFLCFFDLQDKIRELKREAPALRILPRYIRRHLLRCVESRRQKSVLQGFLAL